MAQAMFTQFLRDEFQNVTKAISDATVTLRTGEGFPISAGIYIDFDKGTSFMGFHVPALADPEDTYRVIEQLADGYKEILSSMQSRFRIQEKVSGISTESVPQFLREVHLYHDDTLTSGQKASLIKLYRTRKLQLHFRHHGLGDGAVTRESPE